MAILYGTQSNGETLPVQVNAYGQLVAQGLDGAKGEKGDKGDQGDQGIPGEPGDPGPPVQVVKSIFDPDIYFDSDGEALITWDAKSGTVYDIGGLTIVSIILVASEILVTNPRGRVIVNGFPTLVTKGNYSTERIQAFCNHTNFFKNEAVYTPQLRSSGNEMVFYLRAGSEVNLVRATDINETPEVQKKLAFTIIGERATEAEIVQQRLEALKEAANS